MSTHNICSCGEIRKQFSLIPLLSRLLEYHVDEREDDNSYYTITYTWDNKLQIHSVSDEKKK